MRQWAYGWSLGILLLAACVPEPVPGPPDLGLSGDLAGVDLSSGTDPGATVDVALSTIAVAPTIVVANGVATATITVKLKSGQGTPVLGAMVTLAATGTGNALIQPSGPSDSRGVLSGALKSTRAGSKTVTATVLGVALKGQGFVTFVPGPVHASSSVVALSKTTAVANGSDAVNVTVTLVDEHGNPVPQIAVDIDQTTGSGNVITPAVPPLTDSAGVAVLTLKSTVAETKTVVARFGGPLAGTNLPGAALTFVP